MKGIVEGIARGREKKHEVIGSPILFTARWLHVITQDNFDAYIPRTFSRRTWLVNTVDGQPTLGVFVMDNKPMYWLKQVKYVESIYLDKEPTEQIPLPNMEPKQFSKGKLSFTGVPLSLLAPLVGKLLWWVQSSDGLERVITNHQLENWILTDQRELINLNTKAGSWIKNVLRFCGEKGYISL